MLATVLAVVMSMSPVLTERASANDTANEALKAINIGAAKIKVVNGGWNEADGNYLYYGSYDGNATRYRVLKNEDGKMLIDSDKTLFKAQFDANTQSYKDSEIRGYLKDGKGASGDMFSAKELASLADTTLEAGQYSISPYNYRDDQSIDNKSFLLTASEANILYKDDKARIKNGIAGWWWIRSANTNYTNRVGGVTPTGMLHNANFVYNVNGGVAPAANLKWQTVLFTSANGQSKGSDVGTLDKIEISTAREWKATLIDTGKTITVKKCTIEGNEISVPYTYTDSDVNTAVSQISLVITTGKITTDSSDASDIGEVLYYGKLADANDSKSGVAKFTLPQDLPEGYKVYAIAEDVNEANLTDYASEPQEITWGTDKDGADGTDGADKNGETKRLVKKTVKITKNANANASKTGDEARLGLLVTVVLSTLVTGVGLCVIGRREL